MPRVPVYEVVYIEGDNFYPDEWAIKFSDAARSDIVGGYSTKRKAVKNARRNAKNLADDVGLTKLLVRKKDGEVSEETDYP